jgi:hypothetical protein
MSPVGKPHSAVRRPWYIDRVPSYCVITMATALFRLAWLLRWSLQWRQLWPLRNADADRVDLESRLIKVLMCIRLPATAAHGAKRTFDEA